ncbi:hypothetical protein ACFVTM_13330 [Arthrobacter sp. NPDC058130]|uniref:hypothetical protein n=1 Tax=Arthrobacter sp. NPDC058130 TaxID=3346353 RepID=UPI0036E2FB22
MTRIHNLNGSRALSGLVGQVRAAGLNSPMNNSGIGEGGIEVYEQGTINVSDGNLIVNGTATIDGVLNADGTVTLSGTITISGPLTISGDTDITGDLDVDGPMTTTGTLSVEGVTTLKNDLDVTTGGKIKVGSSMTLTPSTDGGAATFSNGAKLSSTTGAIQMAGTGGTSTVTAAATSAGVTSGSSTLVVFNDGTWKLGTTTANIESFAAGVVDVTGTFKAGPQVYLLSLPTTTQPANLYIDPTTGQLKRSTAA